MFFAWLLALAIRTMLLGDAPVGIVIGLLAVWGIVHFVRLSVHETPVLMVDGDGFWTPSEGRLPWDAVEQVRVDEWSSRGVSHYDLIFELAAWAHHQEDVEISLSMLSMSWNDIVAAVQARIGRRVMIRHPSLLGRIRPQRESGQRAQP